MLEAIAAIAAGFGAAGVAMLLRHLSRGRLPRWLVPAAAGAGMLAFAIAAEYGWYDRVRAGLPEGATIVMAPESKTLFRPWTYWKPLVLSVVIADLRRRLENPEVSEISVVPMIGLARWEPGRNWMEAFDCAAGAHVVLRAGVEIGARGVLSGADWTALTPDDPRLVAVCAGG